MLAGKCLLTFMAAVSDVVALRSRPARTGEQLPMAAIIVHRIAAFFQRFISYLLELMLFG
jgi:hypothetical protein